MAARRYAAVVPAVALLAAAVAAGPSEAATTLGSPDTSVTPDRYRSVSAGTAVGVRQFALQGSLVEAPAGGVLVSASASAKRTTGTENPRIAVLRPVAGGIGATVVASAPLSVTSRQGAVTSVADLHLAVEPGDSLAFVFRRGEVELGVRNRPRPDGAVVTFALPCAPCGTDGGTGDELLFDGSIEPDVDGDLLGDETQDPDGGGLDSFAGDDGDLFFDEGFGDEPTGEDEPPAAKRPKRLRLIKSTPRRDGGVSLLLAIPKAGRLSATASVAAPQPPRAPSTAAAGARLTLASARSRVKQARRVRLELATSRAGRRLLERRGPMRALVSVSFRPATGKPQRLNKPLKLGGLLPRRAEAAR